MKILIDTDQNSHSEETDNRGSKHFVNGLVLGTPKRKNVSVSTSPGFSKAQFTNQLGLIVESSIATKTTYIPQLSHLSPGTSLPLIVFPLLTFILFCFFRPLLIFDIFPRTYVRTISCTLGFLSYLKTTTFAFIAELSIKLEVLSMSTYNY